MKKLTAVLFFAAVLILSGCGNSGKKGAETPQAVETEAVASLDESGAEAIGAEPKTVRNGKFPGGQGIEELRAAKGSGYLLTPDGAYYVDGYSAAGRMSFFDFATLRSFPVCPRPNCTHDDPETCSAFGLSDGSDVMLCSYGGSVYIVENVREMSAKSGISSHANIYKAAADGSERRRVASLGGYTLSGFYVSGDRGYTVAAREITDENGLPTMEYEYFAESFDFKTFELQNLGRISHLYTSDTVGVVGEYGGKINGVRASRAGGARGNELARAGYFGGGGGVLCLSAGRYRRDRLAGRDCQKDRGAPPDRARCGPPCQRNDVQRRNAFGDRARNRGYLQAKGGGNRGERGGDRVLRGRLYPFRAVYAGISQAFAGRAL